MESLETPRDPLPESLADGGEVYAFPLSFAQRRLWFLDQLEPGSPAYNIAVAVRLAGRLDVPALAAALGEIARRHETLHTAFAIVDDEPVQVVSPAPAPSLPMIDLRGLRDHGDREAIAREMSLTEAGRPFDLARSPLWRGSLVRLDGEEHLLLLTLHHIVSDGWSMEVLVREAAALYASFTQRLPSPLPELPIQYADFTLWQLEWLQGEVLEGQLRYWREQLRGAPPRLEIPADRPRSAGTVQVAGSRPCTIPPGCAAALQELGVTEGTTLFMVLLAAFQVVLGRWAGEEDVVVGSVIANRNRPEIEGLIGFFVNTLALRGDLSGDPTFRELLARIRESTLGAYAHQDLPFEKLVEEMAPERSLAHAPLFPALFVVQPPREPLRWIAGLSLEAADVPNGRAKLDLQVDLAPVGGDLAGSWTFDQGLFDPVTIERMLGHFDRLLAAAAADSGRRVSQLSWLSEAERHQTLVEWSAAAAPAAGPCLHDLFAGQAALRPAAVAVVDGSAEISYGELDAWSNRLARWLRRRGVGSESRVAVLLERSWRLVASLLGVLKAGGAYVGLDPSNPRERLGLLLKDSGARLLLAGERLLATSPGVEPVLLEELWPQLAGENATPLPAEAGPENLAYLIYTSGSTGRPKAVGIEHRSAAALVEWSREIFSATELEGVLASTSISFDLSVFELFVPLGRGGTVILAETALELPRLPAAGRVRLINTVPSALAALVRANDIPLGVATVNLAGEALHPSLVDAVHRLPGVRRVLNLYGPSEDTTYSTWAIVAPGSVVSPIGRPVTGTRAFVVGRADEEMPIGVAGELCLAGAGLARGYLERPETTAERFVPDPRPARRGERRYRTGDLVRWRPDGSLEFLGRIDHQVKVRGFRIEPGEIEAALLAHPDVREAVVVAWEDRPGDRRLAAYVAGGARLRWDELRQVLAGRLPEHLVPSAGVVLPALPRTPNGKIDRRALPAPEVREEGSRPARTPVEELLAGIWAEVLGLERVGVEASFFELGGHSLLAVQVASRIRAALGVELPVRALFETPTVAALAERIAAHEESGPAPPLLARRVQEGVPLLSFAQERLWFLDRLEPGSAVYNIPILLRWPGVLEVAVLQQAFGEIVRRHEALRTVFGEIDGAPVQLVREPEPVALPVVDLTGVRADLREPVAQRIAREEARRPFDLATGPLLRLVLLRLSEAEHVLLVSLHHIVSDGWSMGVLQRELAALLVAFREGAPSPLPELAVQYADYAVWQRSWLRDEALASRLSFWRQALGPEPVSLELPLDRPRPAVPSSRGGWVPVALPADLSQGLKALGHREGATLFLTLLAGWQGLLSRITGQADVRVGTPVAGRDRVELEPLVGFFANTLVLRGDLTGDPGLRTLLGRSRTTLLAAWSHQDLPFEKLVAELEPERSLSRTPLFQVMLALQGAPSGGPAVPWSQVEGVSSGTAKFDLLLGLSPSSSGLRGALEYSADLFDATTAHRLADHLERLLRGALERPDVSLSKLSLLSAAEAHQLLVEGNDTAAEVPEAGVYALFEAQARRTPEAPALRQGERVLSYAELRRRAWSLALLLRRLGVQRGDRVGLLVERSPELMVAILGVLAADAAYVPLDPSYPQERLRLVLADAGISILLSRPREMSALPDLDMPWIDLEALGEEATEGLLWPGSVAGGADLAYVLYTSGSTGLPKGVAMSHGVLVSLLRWHEESLPLSPGARVLQFASPSFDVSFQEIFSTWCGGGELVLVPEEERRDPQRLLAFLDELGIRRLFLPFVALQSLAESAWGGALVPEGLREIITAGEQLRITRQVAWLLEQFPGCVLHNHYGPTETHVATALTLMGSPGDWPELPAIGRPVANARTLVLGRSLEPLPVGVAGELLLGGEAPARGYLDRPDLTAERFVPDPYAVAPGARLYRTGDLARWRPDGRLEFLGRLDHQIKVRGFRVEPGEVEAALSACPGVRDAVVALREVRPGDRRLVAWLTVEVGSAVATADLRRSLEMSLPEFMIPASFMVVEAFPRTPSGKVDRRGLPTPATGGGEGEQREPRTPVEELLAGVFAEVLGVERVGVEAGFFELGGHSLLAVQVTSRVRAALGVELPVRALFETSSVSGLARQVAELLQARQGRPEAPPLARGGRPDVLPLSYAQERLWFLDQLEPGTALYNLPLALRWPGELDLAALGRTWEEIVQRHEVLRTVFVTASVGPVQVIRPPEPLALPLVDLAGLALAQREGEARRLLREEARRPFDLAAGPLRFGLLRLDAAQHVLHLNLHHIVADGWSLGLLRREMTALYGSLRQGRLPRLPELPVQYADYAVWQRQWLQGEALEARLAFWRQRLGAQTAPLELPADRPRPAVSSHRGGQVPVTLPFALTQQLEALGRSAGATLFLTLLAGWQALLSRCTGQEEVRVGTPVAGRDRVELEELVGFFVNILVLPGDLTGSPGLRLFLDRLRATLLEAWSHQDLPFEKLVAELDPQRSLARSPLFQVLFVLQRALPAGDTPAEAFEAEEVPTGTAKFDLTLALSPTPSGLRGVLEYSADLFDATTAARLAAHLERLLAAAAAHPDVPLTDLPLLSAEEAHQLLVEANDTASAAELDRPIPELFTEQARRTPDSVAVVCGETALTYGELLRRAEAVAAHLADLGVGPEQRVGVCMERSADLIVALLGTLASGGAYVPLDPAYPKERLAFMVADGGLRAVLTQGATRLHLPPFGSAVVDVGDMAAGLWRGARPRIAPESLAYVIYTSGSTGHPKGVGISHGNAAALMRWAGAAFTPEELGGMLASTSVSFDLSVFEIFAPLCHGGTVILAENALELPRLAETGRVRVVNTVPSAAAALVRDGGLPRNVRTVCLAGEALSRALVEQLVASPGVERVVNLYGPTEDTTYSTGAPMEAAVSGAPTIGRSLQERRSYVVDASLRPVSLGVVGELLVGGAGLARGYLGRPELTAEKFVPDELGGGAGDRLYRTGDLVRRLADHRLSFLGRVDHQVKVRGFRIELGEVEEALLAQPGVREAVAAAREDRPGDRRLVVYVVPEDGRLLSWEDLSRGLAGRLPAHMVPSAGVFLLALPRTPNGKIDRRALPAPEVREEESSRPARTPVEELLAGICAEVLGLERMGVEASFFDLGGHSLLAVQVVSRVRATLGVELPVRAVFEAPTVEALAARIAALRQEGEAPTPPLVQAPRAGAPPLSYAQERLWFLDQLEQGSSLYNMPVFVRLRGELDLALLAWAFAEVVRRHEVLRTSFRKVRNQPRQHIASPGAIPQPLVDLSALSEFRRDGEERRLALEEARRPFDLAAGPLLRILLLRREGTEHTLGVVLHHIVSDGWSMSILIREVVALYSAHRMGVPSPLPELPVQYADFAQWQRQWLQGEVLRDQLAYWRRQLAGAPAMVKLPADRQRPERPTQRGAVALFTLAPPLVASLHRLCRREGVTLYMLLLAAFGVLLYRGSGQEDLLVGSATANRTRGEVEGLIGFFVNMLVLRLDLSGTPRFIDLLARVREVALGAYSHQDLPFERLVEELRPGLEGQPLQVAFGLNNVPQEAAIELPGLVLEPCELDAEAARFDLTVWVVEQGEGLRVKWTYNTDLFERTGIERLHDRFEALLGSIVARPEGRLHTLGMARAKPEEEGAPGAKAQLFPITRRKAAGLAAAALDGREAERNLS